MPNHTDTENTPGQDGSEHRHSRLQKETKLDRIANELRVTPLRG